MDVSFISYSKSALSLLKDAVLPSLTAQQKKIILVASLALGLLATYFLVVRYFKAKPLSDETGYENDSSNGPGKQTFASRIVLSEEGEYSDGLLHGQGKKIYANGIVAEGEYRDGLLHGQGKKTFVSGAVWEGEFRDGCLNGQGKQTFASGKVIEGAFKHNQLYKGTITFPDGTVEHVE